MDHPVRRGVLIAVGLLLAITSSTRPVFTQSTPSYGVIDIGSLGEGLVSPAAMDSYGYFVVGSAVSAQGQLHAFGGNPYSSLKDRGTLGGATSEGWGTNDRGDIVGSADTSAGTRHAALWSGEQVTDLGTLGGLRSEAFDINNLQTVVGASVTSGGEVRAFIYRDGVMSPLDVGIVTRSVAWGINDHGQVVGSSYATPTSPERAFRWDNGVVTPLGALSADAFSVALDISEAGVVVGYSGLSATSNDMRAFRWENGVMQDLGTLGGTQSAAVAVNEEGTIVGWSFDGQGRRRAAVWLDGQIYDLNDLIKPGAGWVMEAAVDIGETGVILGAGRYNGFRRGFIAVPPIDLRLSITHHPFDLDGNIPNPHEAGTDLILHASVFTDGPFTATNVVVRDSISGPIEYVSWSNADCVKDGQTLTCRLPTLGFVGRGVVIRTRATGPGVITHSATIISSDQVDSTPNNNSATQSNLAVSLHSLELSSTTVSGGQPVLSRATLTSPTPSGGARVRLMSSHPDIASVPAEFDVLPWSGDALFREFYVTTAPVTVPTTVLISATYGLVTETVPLTIMPSGASWPYGETTHAVPGRIEAENYDGGGHNAGYYDTTPGNEGNVYRHEGVDIEATTDAGGGFNVGWMAPAEWLQYTVDVPTAGTYRLDLRVAANGVGGRVHVTFDGVDRSGPLNIPDTGGWQAWTTITTPVTLTAGTQRMRLMVDAAGPTSVVGNVNYIQLTATASSSTPFNGTPVALPGVVQAENFDAGGQDVAYGDTTPGNEGGQHRQADHVDIQTTSDAGGGFNVGWMAVGEWLQYTVDVAAAGTYRLDLRVAANGAGGRMHVEFDGTDTTGALTVPDTGGWQSWTTISTNVTLAAGTQHMRVVVDSAGAAGVVGNLGFIEIASVATAAPQEIVVHASDIPAHALHGSWSKGSDGASPGGVLLQTPNTGFAVPNTPLAAPTHYVDVTFTPVANTPYAIWLHLKALNNDKFNDAVWVQFSAAQANGGAVFPIGSTSALLVNLATDATATSLNDWGWQNGAYWLTQPTTFTFPTGGTQTLRIQVREDGVQLDQIVLSPKAHLRAAPGGPTHDLTIVPKPQ